MVKRYWKNEYNEKQWKKLIDEASKLGCKLQYSIYGNTCLIDSTETETRLLKFANEMDDFSNRRKWAEHLRERIQRAAM